jgi:hypothetical protein
MPKGKMSTRGAKQANRRKVTYSNRRKSAAKAVRSKRGRSRY